MINLQLVLSQSVLSIRGSYPARVKNIFFGVKGQQCCYLVKNCPKYSKTSPWGLIFFHNRLQIEHIEIKNPSKYAIFDQFLELNV